VTQIKSKKEKKKQINKKNQHDIDYDDV